MLVPTRTSNRHIYLIQPKFPPSYWGMEHFLTLTPFRAVFPPLGLLTLAAVTPRDFRVTLCDENAGEVVDYDTDAGLVGITGYLIQMDRVFEMADRFRALGKTVILGGPIANLLPDECRAHCDVLFEGEAEYTWPRFLREYAAGAERLVIGMGVDSHQGQRSGGHGSTLDRSGRWAGRTCHRYPEPQG